MNAYHSPSGGECSTGNIRRIQRVYEKIERPIDAHGIEAALVRCVDFVQFGGCVGRRFTRQEVGELDPRYCGRIEALTGKVLTWAVYLCRFCRPS
jgi:hypothetical protein